MVHRFVSFLVKRERGLCDLLRVELEPGTANAPTVGGCVRPARPRADSRPRSWWHRWRAHPMPRPLHGSRSRRWSPRQRPGGSRCVRAVRARRIRFFHPGAHRLKGLRRLRAECAGRGNFTWYRCSPYRGVGGGRWLLGHGLLSCSPSRGGYRYLRKMRAIPLPCSAARRYHCSAASGFFSTPSPWW